MSREAPPGIRLLRGLRGRSGPGVGGQDSSRRLRTYKGAVLVLTFVAYACYHASRKPTSIVKSVLYPEPPPTRGARRPWPLGHVFIRPEPEDGAVARRKNKGWAPFDGEDGTVKLGEVDLAFLVSYSLGMYVAGHLGDSLDLRNFLAAGMVGSGCFVGLFGMGYFWGIHVFGYYVAMQVLAGLFQATGWPSVVAVVGNWFGRRKRGLIMGIWNAHTSVGNITGSLIAAVMLKYGWGWSFVVPGVLMAVVGVVLFLFLPVSPEAMGVDRVAEDDTMKYSEKTEASEPLLAERKESEPLPGERTEEKEKAVGFVEAWRIPGVAPFALCLFFCKLVAYTFLYWLPFYISHTAIDGKYLSDSVAGTLSTLFDVGGVLGGILAGHISDRLDARAITAAGFMYCAIPALFFYRVYGSISLYWNIALMFVAGIFVNGPYALITTAVSADLGTHSSLNGNSRALATVTAIIDGTGSVGAALGPLLTGYVSAKSWNDVFTMLMAAAFVAGLLLTKLVVAEVTAKMESSRSCGADDPLASPLATEV